MALEKQLAELSRKRGGEEEVKGTDDVFEAYVAELYSIYKTNKAKEDEMKAKQAAADAAKKDDKKAAKKKGKDTGTIGFGKGTRQFFNYL